MAETFANDMANKELIAKIHKQFTLFNIKKTNSLVKKKIGRRPELTFFQRRHTEGQQTNEKILNIINHQGNANHTEISTCYIGYYPKDKKQMLVKMWRKGKPHVLLLGMLIVQPLWKQYGGSSRD